MKKLMFTCLMAGMGQLFAQNLTLNDLQFMLNTGNADSITAHFLPMGFASVDKKLSIKMLNGDIENTWLFKADNNPEASPVTVLHQVLKNDGREMMIWYETSNVYFYNQLMEQLPGKGFSFCGTMAGGSNRTELCFCNSHEELRTAVTNTVNRYPFQFTFRKSDKQTRKTAAVPRKTRMIAQKEKARPPTKAKRRYYYPGDFYN